MRIRGRDYRSGQIHDFLCQDGRIAAIGPAAGNADLVSDWVVPGCCDVQINGAGGVGFAATDLTPEGVAAVVRRCRRHGIAQLLPTLITAAQDTLLHGFSVLAAAREADPDLARAVPGYHLEGPWISPEDGPRGAHPRAHVRPPDWDEFRRLQDAAAGGIRMVTLAPEWPGAPAIIERLSAAGVIVAVGHTSAAPAVIREAVAAGARISTHLGNGSHALLPRHENYFLEQLACDDLHASIICDGHHLPPSLMKILVRVKSPARLILTCDASSLAGVAPGRYRAWEQDFEVLPEGKIVVPGTTFLGGSWAFTDLCLVNAVRFGGVSLAEAVAMACHQPRDLLGLPRQDLEVGHPADLLLLEGEPGIDLRPKAAIVSGRVCEEDRTC